jgi:hypothetical protein
MELCTTMAFEVSLVAFGVCSGYRQGGAKRTRLQE